MKKTLKKLIVFLVLLAACFSYACTPVSLPPDPTPDPTDKGYEEPGFIAKPVFGIAPEFDEGMAYYNSQSSVLLEGNDLYVFYTVNYRPNAGDDTYFEAKASSAIAVRKAVKGDNNKWIYGDKKIVVKCSESGWDSKSIQNSSVIKGKFKYKTIEYSYLMAYQGNDIASSKHYSIGFAVAENPFGPWIKVTESAAVQYNPDEYGDTWGIGNPSLISFDSLGKVYLFYTQGDDYGSTTHVLSLDCSDLENIKGLNAPSMLPVKGLNPQGKNEVGLMDCDFALDIEKGLLIMVRDFDTVGDFPGGVEVAVMNISFEDKDGQPYTEDGFFLKELFDVDAAWEKYIRLDALAGEFADLDAEQASPSSYGWSYAFASSILKNEYGYVEKVESITLSLTVSDENDDGESYFCQTLILYEVDLSKLKALADW